MCLTVADLIELLLLLWLVRIWKRRKKRRHQHLQHIRIANLQLHHPVHHLHSQLSELIRRRESKEKKTRVALRRWRILNSVHDTLTDIEREEQSTGSQGSHPRHPAHPLVVLYHPNEVAVQDGASAKAVAFKWSLTKQAVGLGYPITTPPYQLRVVSMAKKKDRMGACSAFYLGRKAETRVRSRRSRGFWAKRVLDESLADADAGHESGWSFA